MLQATLGWLKLLWNSGTLLKLIPVIIELIRFLEKTDVVDDDVGEKINTVLAKLTPIAGSKPSE